MELIFERTLSLLLGATVLLILIFGASGIIQLRGNRNVNYPILMTLGSLGFGTSLAALAAWPEGTHVFPYACLLLGFTFMQMCFSDAPATCKLEKVYLGACAACTAMSMLVPLGFSLRAPEYPIEGIEWLMLLCSITSCLFGVMIIARSRFTIPVSYPILK